MASGRQSHAKPACKSQSIGLTNRHARENRRLENSPAVKTNTSETTRVLSCPKLAPNGALVHLCLGTDNEQLRIGSLRALTEVQHCKGQLGLASCTFFASFEPISSSDIEIGAIISNDISLSLMERRIAEQAKAQSRPETGFLNRLFTVIIVRIGCSENGSLSFLELRLRCQRPFV